MNKNEIKTFDDSRLIKGTKRLGDSGNLIRLRERVAFNRSESLADFHYLNLLDIQIESFKKFLQEDIPPYERKDVGLQAVFNANFPIEDKNGIFQLEFLSYSIENPKSSEEECRERELTYSRPLKARMRLSSRAEQGTEDYFEAIEQEVYLGTIPVMTDRGTFIINGAERVIVSQIHRSPGVFFDSTIHTNGTNLYSARIIPFRGSWIEFQTDIHGLMYAYVDRKKKFPVTTLLRALGYSSDEEIMGLFNLTENITKKEIVQKVKDEETNEDVYKYLNRKIASEIVDLETGEIIASREDILTEALLDKIAEIHVTPIQIFSYTSAADAPVMAITLEKDKTHNRDEALLEVYRQLRTSEAPDLEQAWALLEKMFFDPKRYNLGEVGRRKINKRLDGIVLDSGEKISLKIPLDHLTVTVEDMVAIIKYLLDLHKKGAEGDDIDHLSNRRVKTVGEQFAGQINIGFARMSRTIKERLGIKDETQLTPAELVNSRMLTSVVNSFFGTNQLSQFMDQTNPLAELTNKRRISALGPGGLTRERAGFEVRDVHYTHYGRLCPIETPEGPNIGLISSLALHAKINEMGFIETAYRKVKKGKVTDEVVYLTAEEEDKEYICPASTKTNGKGKIDEPTIIARHEGDYISVAPEDITCMDVSTDQIASAAAALIPFLEHAAANRALMGSNMQRQAVPLMRPSAPIVGTGMETRVAKDSHALIIAEEDGIVEYSDADKIIVNYTDNRSENEKIGDFNYQQRKEYKLVKYFRTNQNTCINQHPIVHSDEKIRKGQPLVDTMSTDTGDLALGRNVLVAFMPWNGYNFEDAIIISEKIVAKDIFTSIHIDEFSLQVRDTKRGDEEFTKELPNVSEDTVKDLDDNGIVMVGSAIREGDIIIGKVTPKGESDPTPEEKLLRAIFGDKAGDVKDVSLKATPGVRGTVINTKLFTRSYEKDKKAEKKKLDLLDKVEKKQLINVFETFITRFISITDGEKSVGVKLNNGIQVFKSGTLYSEKNIADKKIALKLYAHSEGREKSNALRGVIVFKDKEVEFIGTDEATKFSNSDLTDSLQLPYNVDYVADAEKNKAINLLINNYQRKVSSIMSDMRNQRNKVAAGDELPVGIQKMAKVYIAKKRKLQVGDKMAGRHGNKGIVSKIVPIEDMPFLPDGTPVEIILNPLGVPSRMNLGQLYETALGWAGLKLGVHFATPIFESATWNQVNEYMQMADLPEGGKTILYDGKTGDAFDEKVTVGIIYMLKLSHLVEDKIHARSIGPYSLITQQPLGGKAQFGGQRLGEMEVWALEAYGAAHTLKEMISQKSDDVDGRSKMYEAIVKGDNIPYSNVPESFQVLTHELQGLCLDLVDENGVSLVEMGNNVR